MARTAVAATQNSKALSHDLLSGLSPEEFEAEAQRLAEMRALPPGARERLKRRLIERLKTPVDEPSWGPDWRHKGEKVAGYNQALDRKSRVRAEPEEPAPGEDDDAIIARNMEKSRQVARYMPLYLGAVGLALAIVLTSMFVDYHIIREIWTRALANEFMVVPPALQASVVFKSLQVVFAVLIVHFMLKATGRVGKHTMIATSFALALLMIAGLGYLVAYNNMAGGTATASEQTAARPSGDAIQQLFAGDNGVEKAAVAAAPRITEEGVSLGLPKLSDTSLAHADKWFWLAFASGVFFIVTTVAALYMQTVENNLRNIHIASDYRQRRRDFVLLHLIEAAEARG